jgi:hypothetical protein
VLGVASLQRGHRLRVVVPDETVEQLVLDAETAQARAEEAYVVACAAYNGSLQSLELAQEALEAAKAAGEAARRCAERTPTIPEPAAPLDG